MLSMNTKRVLIYALHHPSSPHIYIGKSSRGIMRAREHLQESKLRSQSRWPKTKWILSLRERGLEPEIVVLEETTKRKGDEAERFHVAYFQSIGLLPLNLTDGGEANWRWSPEIRAKISAAHKGKPKSLEACRNMSLAAKKKWKRAGFREEHIAKQRALVTDETRARSAAGAKLSSHDWQRTRKGRAILKKAWEKRRANARARERNAISQKADRRRSK
jgi:hypothetical protein